MGLGWFWGFLEKGFGRGLTRSKIEIFENVRECFSRVGTPRNSSLVTKIEERHHTTIFFSTHIFYGIINILSARGRRQGAKPLGSAAPRRGARRVRHWGTLFTQSIHIHTEYSQCMVPGGPPLAPAPLGIGLENHQNFLKKRKKVMIRGR